jgi:uncharacterized protein (DUF2141 family)
MGIHTHSINIMKHLQRIPVHLISALIILLSFSFNAQTTVKKGNITVIVSNIRNTDGQIGFCLFKTVSGFPHPEKAFLISFVKINNSACAYTFTGIDTGTYAVSVFHDENNDKTLNTNFLGIPKEGVGVSNNAKGHFGPPKYDDAKFEFNGTDKTITISISYL